ncbi:MAG: hypothetical protein OXC01_06495 [Immundisolibacterales bacterium]|nr:hypothetical protein [Immundisolibacterales bacterium]
MEVLSQETIAILAVGAVIAGFFWSLHRDLAGLRDRISRLEGLFEGLRDSVARLHESVSELRSSVTGLQGSVAAVQSSVTALHGSVSGVRDSVSRLGQRVDNRFPPPPAADD